LTAVVVANALENDEPGDLLVVLDARDLGAALVVAKDVLEGPRRACRVERPPFVRHGHGNHAARPRYAQERLQRAKRVLAVLEEVVGDDEVLGAIPDRRELGGIVDDVRADDLLVDEPDTRRTGRSSTGW
jgi:hypothetical protein